MRNKRGLIEVFAVLGTIFFLFLAIALVVLSLNKTAVYQSASFENEGQIIGADEKFVTVKYNDLGSGEGLCVDSDEDNGDFSSQSFSSGLVVYMYNACGEDINLLSGNNNPQCSFVLSASDVCKGSNVLIEQSCGENGLEAREVYCEFGCLSGICLEQPVNLALCGDGILNSGEQCDDGNLISGDGCSSFCIYEIGEAELTDALNAINRWKSGDGNLKEALNSIRQWKG